MAYHQMVKVLATNTLIKTGEDIIMMYKASVGLILRYSIRNTTAASVEKTR